MEINSILNQISSSLEKISISNRVNNYNLISGRLGGPQYLVSFSDLIVDSSSNPNEIKKAVMITRSEQSVEEIIMRSIDLTSESNRLVDVLNRRIEIERLALKGGR
ncbi:hypothetical protein [Vibrio coralliilyticus]|uniref:hypothetical protein n=1 Tax=Vibrio coralliilyticus TaxID=190893 RepID=UPI00036057E9|nr:hypothetical protein [Vibrio coralliilyticus]